VRPRGPPCAATANLAVLDPVRLTFDDLAERGRLLAAYCAGFPNAISIDLSWCPRREAFRRPGA
jgi:hypothetical protein